MIDTLNIAINCTARFRNKANDEQIDFKINRKPDKNLMNRFAECPLIELKRP